MSLIISDETIQKTRLSESEIKTEFGLWLFEQQRLTLARAARFLNMTRLQFQKLLAERKIPVHYEVADLEQDLETLVRLGI